MQNQYPHVIKSPKPKQSNAWRSNSVPNVYKNLNHRVNHFKSNLSGDIETNPGPVINSTKTIQASYSQDNVAAPEMIIVFNVNYQLRYSLRCTATIHGTCEVQDFNYCMSFANAMQALLGQNYNSFFNNPWYYSRFLL